MLGLITLLAFKFTPNDTDDLARYFWALDHFRENGKAELEWYISDGKYSWDVYRCMAYYFYFCSRFENNHVLPALTIFICYGSMFLIINKAANRFNVNKMNLFLGAMFAISTYWFYDTASGIRNGLAFSIAFLATYYHLVERKYIPICYALYVVAAFSHSAGIMPVLIVAVTVLTFNNDGKLLKYFLAFGIVGGNMLLQYVAKSSSSKFILRLAGQAEAHEATSINLMETGTMFRVNIAVLVVLIALLWYFSYFFTHGEHSKELKRFYKYSSLYTFFMIGCMFSGLLFVRFMRWITPVLIALIFMIGSQLRDDQIRRIGKKQAYSLSPVLSERIHLKQMVTTLFVVFTAVHFWYLCEGSSLYWIHF